MATEGIREGSLGVNNLSFIPLHASVLKSKARTFICVYLSEFAPNIDKLSNKILNLMCAIFVIIDLFAFHSAFILTLKFCQSY